MSKINFSFDWSYTKLSVNKSETGITQTAALFFKVKSTSGKPTFYAQKSVDIWSSNISEIKSINGTSVWNIAIIVIN